MEILSVVLILMSPYTALIPGLIAGIKSLKSSMAKGFSLFSLNSSTNLIFIISFFMALSGALNGNMISVTAFIPMFAAGLMNEYIIQNYEDEEKIKSLLSSFVKLGTICVALGFIEKTMSFFMDMSFMKTLFWSASYTIENEGYRIYSTFGNPNIAASWFSALLIISIFFASNESGTKKIFYNACIALLLISIGLTGSRGATVALGAGLFVYALLKRDRKSIITLISIVSLSTVALLLLPEANRPIAGRTDIWTVCMDMIKSKPLFGHGVMGILNQTYEIHAHNIWLSFLAMTGIAGLISYLAYRFQIYKSILSSSLKIFKRDTEQNKYDIAIPLISIQAMIIVHGIVDFPFFVPQGLVLFIGTGAFITVLEKSRKKQAS